MSKGLTQLITADDDLRAVESIGDLVVLLERRFPLTDVRFSILRRTDHLPEVGVPGWTSTIAFSVIQAGPAIWQVRDALNAVRVRVSPYLRVDSTEGHRRLSAPCVLHAEDFPSMWIMERIRRS